jgi:hypothetical protein
MGCREPSLTTKSASWVSSSGCIKPATAITPRRSTGS